jgi:hypothetical protein
VNYLYRNNLPVSPQTSFVTVEGTVLRVGGSSVDIEGVELAVGLAGALTEMALRGKSDVFCERQCYLRVLTLFQVGTLLGCQRTSVLVHVGHPVLGVSPLPDRQESGYRLYLSSED